MYAYDLQEYKEDDLPSAVSINSHVYALAGMQMLQLKSNWMSTPCGSTPVQGCMEELSGDLLHSLFSSSIRADFPAGHENLVHNQLVFAPSHVASGMTSDMPTDGG
jgi:hypothetical protein